MNGDELRIITVRDPWAWAIIHAGKDVENRVRNIAGTYRGPVAIHAGLAQDEAGFHHPELRRRMWWKLQERLTPGAILGVVDLVDVHVVQASTSGRGNVCFDDRTPTGDVCSIWAQPFDEFDAKRGHHLVLANPRPLPEPIPFKGALGLRTLDEATAARVWAAIA